MAALLQTEADQMPTVKYNCPGIKVTIVRMFLATQVSHEAFPSHNSTSEGMIYVENIILYGDVVHKGFLK